jgi:zinc D-Ala-D-Ala carboxypeptidase
MLLSEHITLEEMIRSEWAERHGVPNQPGTAVIENLKLTAAMLEEVRALILSRVFVHSGYRAVLVNVGVNGSPTSKHPRGLAGDFTCPDFGGGSNAVICRTIERSKIVYDQLILEYSWIHMGLAEAGVIPRRESLTKRSAAAPYITGIVEIENGDSEPAD